MSIGRHTVPWISCDYRAPSWNETEDECWETTGGDRIGETAAELRTRSQGWVQGNPLWHRTTVGPARFVDLCPTCAKKPDVHGATRTDHTKDAH
jgi:hypothetical protein